MNDKKPGSALMPKFRAELGTGERVIVETESLPVLAQLVVTNMMEFMVPQRDIFLGLIAQRMPRERAELLVKACAAACDYVTKQSFGDDELDVEVMLMYLVETLRMDPEFVRDVVDGVVRFSNAA